MSKLSGTLVEKHEMYDYHVNKNFHRPTIKDFSSLTLFFSWFNLVYIRKI